MTRSLLIAIRQSALAQVAMCDGLLAALEPSAECQHPTSERVDSTPMGGPAAFICRTCGKEVVA